MKKDFYAVYDSITCPHCQVKQTGIERVYVMATGEMVEFEPDNQVKHFLKNYPEEQFAIKCAWSGCGQLITGDDLERVTRNKIKSPSDFRYKPNTYHT